MILPTVKYMQDTFSCDVENGLLFRKQAIRNLPAGRQVGRPDKRGVVRIGLYDRARRRVNIKLSHIVWLFAYGSWPSEYLDHINGNPRDNRLANLRLATPAQNSRNKRVHRNSISGIKGVRFKNGKWHARIQIGSFNTAEEAARAYARAARLFFGDFAYSDASTYPGFLGPVPPD